ncbi:MAG TPA: SapC family protein [Allosphingosinicella sp.]|nr:SapC family protein [Allosphingosinicella sp.]
MASAPNSLPLFYNRLEPLSSTAHGHLKARTAQAAPFLAKAHAIPLTSDEFVICQRFYPIVFSVGESPVPLALMGLNEGVNVFIDDEGKPNGELYIPAYVRRYPFMLARLRPDADELSLCFDPSSDVIGEFDDGQPLFENGKPSEATNGLLKFCEEFELSAQRTNAFMKELADLKLLIDGEVAIQVSDDSAPFVYRGFQMVSDERLRDMRGDELRKINQNGILPLIIAHLFSLQLMREIFGRQVAQGKVPQAPPIPANA